MHSLRISAPFGQGLRLAALSVLGLGALGVVCWAQLPFSAKSLPTITHAAQVPGMSGTECTAAVLDEFPDACIRMLSTHSGEEEIYRALQAGARGYIVKSIIREEMLCAVHEVHQGRQYVDPIVASHLAERRLHRPLTSREVEVLRMVAHGLGNKEIAGALDIAEVTVKLHVNVLEKLHVKDRTQAVTVALQRGIIALE